MVCGGPQTDCRPILPMQEATICRVLHAETHSAKCTWNHSPILEQIKLNYNALQGLSKESIQTPIFRQRLQTIFELEAVEHDRCCQQQTLHITKNPLHLYRLSKGTVLKDTH